MWTVDGNSEDENTERHTVKVLLIIGTALLFIIVGIAIKLERSRKKNNIKISGTKFM